MIHDLLREGVFSEREPMKSKWHGREGRYLRGKWIIMRTLAGWWAANIRRDMCITPAPIVTRTLREAKRRVNRRAFRGTP